MRSFFLFLIVSPLIVVGKQVDAANTPSIKKEESGLPNISTRSQKMLKGWDVFADFLVWQASEETTAVWAESLSEPPFNTTVFKTKDLSFNWDFGFRIGLGYNLEYDQWDTQLYWTWFRTRANSSINTGIIASEFFAGFVVDKDVALSAKMQWTILYNMLDWELGRSYWISKNLSLRPFIGIKGGWINQTLDSRWKNFKILPNLSVIHFSSKENLKNNFWGIGPSAGVNSKWKIKNFSTHFFSLFGDFSTAMMWGTWECKDVYKNTTPKDIFIQTKNSSLGALMLRGCLGIGWDTDFNQGRSHFTTQLGYEMQIWFNQLRIPTFQLLRLHGDLTLQGGTLHCRFDF